MSRLAFALSLALAAGCAPRLIAGTPIADSADNRAIMELMRRYKNAFEARDADAVAALAGAHYLDAKESISKATLDTELAKDFAKVKDARLDLQVHKIEVQGDRATAYFFYSAAYLLDTAASEWKRESDDKSMTFERVGAEWKVASGL